MAKRKIPTLTENKLNEGYIEFKYSDDIFFEKYVLTDAWWFRKWLPSEHQDKCLDLEVFANQLKAYSTKYNNPPVISWEVLIYSRRLDTPPLSWSSEEDYEDSYDLNKFIKTLREMENGQRQRNSIGSFMGIATIVVLPVNKQRRANRKRTHIPRGLRHEVFKRDNYTCCECGATKEDGVTLHIDHIIPVSKGGTDELSNLQTLCKACNLNKSDVIQ